jgi:hypothetical protein
MRATTLTPLLTLYLGDPPEGWLYRIASKCARIRARVGNSPRIEKENMMARREGTISAKQPEESTEPAPSQAKRPDIGQFRLQVDRQTKGSFTTYEAAEKAAIAIKTAHPIVQVAVYDIKESQNKLIELPAKETT